MPHVVQRNFKVGNRRTFHLLDAIRGVAALVIVQRHAAHLMGGLAWTSTYLAVDLFFILSGFVISYSYEARIGSGMTWRHFMTLRIIRLYPLYVIGLSLGIIVLFGSQLHAPTHTVDWILTLQALFSAVLMLPNWGLPAIVGPRWSLTYELIANAVYGATVRRLTLPLLWMAIAISGVALILIVASTGTIDAGWEIWQAPIALARVFFSFSSGVLLYRIHANQVSLRWIIATCVLATLLCLMAFFVDHDLLLSVELSFIFIVFPTLTLAAASVDVYGGWISLCNVLGSTSYAVYVIHQPAISLYEAALRRTSNTIPVPWAGWILLVLLMLAAWLLDWIYDTPIRRWLVATLSKNRLLSRYRRG